MVDDNSTPEIPGDNPIPAPPPSAGEIDAEIARKLVEWQIAKAEGRY